MANPKYADLPGIAHDQPDVYETNDLPESDQITAEAISDQSDNVETLAISATEAYEKFKGTSVDSSSVDFTDRIGSRIRKGYLVRYGDWEMQGTGSHEQETVQQKYHRLQHETRELLEELNDLKETAIKDKQAEGMSPIDLAQKTSLLQKQLVELNLEQTLGTEVIADLSDPEKTLHRNLISHLESVKDLPQPEKKTKSPLTQTVKDNVVYELYYKPEQSKLMEASKVADLDQRLKHLESIIGRDEVKLSPITSQTSGKSIVNAVGILSAKLSLLEPAILDQVEARLVVIQQRLQQLNEKKAQVEEADKLTKVSELFELMKKAEVMSGTLPDVVERLVALQELHEQALQFSKALMQLDTIQQQILKSHHNNEKVLQEFQETFGTNMDSIKKNITSLENRISHLK